ncbi:MAG: dephospho-CoA kinase, partial [Propionibacteriaceae bacterium]
MEPDRARARNKKRVRVGLTGGIASGKSLVAAELVARGAIVIDADVLAREVV